MEFQFHNGTINTTLPLFLHCIILCFNSTTVQLILEVLHLFSPYTECFNSTTVQLILLYLRVIAPRLDLFQFHNGTINTLTNTQKKQLKMSELANNKYAFYMINYVDG